MGRDTGVTLAAVASSSGSVNGSCFSLGKPIGLPPTVSTKAVGEGQLPHDDAHAGVVLDRCAAKSGKLKILFFQAK